MRKLRQTPPFLSMLDFGSRHPLLAVGVPLVLAAGFGVWASRSGSWLGWGLTVLSVLLAAGGVLVAGLLAEGRS